MTRRILPPLHQRETRIRLLAWSYHDATQGTSDGARGDKPGSRLLERNPELWPKGSYQQLEHALDRLRTMDRRAYIRFILIHIDQPDWWQTRPGTGLAEIARLMPQQVFVPAVIAEAAGYLPSDAKTFQAPSGRHATLIAAGTSAPKTRRPSLKWVEPPWLPTT